MNEDDDDEESLIGISASPVPTWNRRKTLLLIVFFVLSFGTVLLLLCMFSEPFASFLSHSFSLRSNN